MQLYAYVISALVIALLAILFALQNTNLVTIQFFAWEYRQSLAFVLLGTLALGVFIGFLFSVPAILRRELKAARIQKQVDKLSGIVQEKDQAISSVSYETQSVRQNYETLLQSIGVIEPTTGLLRQDLLPKAIAAHLAQRQAQGAIAQVPALGLLMLKVKPTLIDGLTPEQLFAAVAQVLQKTAQPKSWLYGDGQGLYTVMADGLDNRSLTQYGEALQAALLEQPPTLPTGQAIDLEVTVGGAIADTQTGFDGQRLISTAETALEQALNRGRNRVRILQVS